MRNITLLVLVFLLTSGTAFARFGTEGPQYFPPTGGPLIVDAPTRPEAPEGSVSSNTLPREMPREVREQMPSQAQNTVQRERMSASTTASSSRPTSRQVAKEIAKRRGTPGLVTSVGSNSFTLTTPKVKGQATTTFTVTVSSTTKYNRASSTASFSDIVAGSRVEVLGLVSTTAKTITAERIVIAGEMKKEMPKKEGVLNKVKGFILGKPAEDNENFKKGTVLDAENTPAAAIEGNGFMGGFFQKIFSWF